MSDIVIEVENLSKKYTIRHQNGRGDGLSHAIHGMATAPFRWLFEQGIKHNGNGNGSTRLTSHSKAEEFHALKDVSFQVKCGEVVGIIGRNGAGKSTLLKILSRITEPTNGRVRIKGRVASLLEVGTGFHPELTGRENIFLNGAILGMTRQEIKRKFDEIVGFAEIEEFLDTPVKRYSSGMYIRLAFGVAAHLDAEILVIDEILAVGDTQFQKKCLRKMDGVSKDGRTVLFVSHNMSLIQTLCNRSLLLSKGRIVKNGTTAEIIAAYVHEPSQTLSDLTERKDRNGLGEVRVDSLALCDDSGNPTTTLLMGHGAKFAFELSKRLPYIVCRFTIVNTVGQPIVHFNSDLKAPHDVVDLRLKPMFCCEVPYLPLAPGKYSINVAIQTHGELQDHVEAAAVFDVEPTPVDGRPIAYHSMGAICLPHRWIDGT